MDHCTYGSELAKTLKGKMALFCSLSINTQSRHWGWLCRKQKRKKIQVKNRIG